MNASVDNEEGNLAVVYDNEYLPLTSNIVTNKLVFPLSVTLDAEPEVIDQREIELDYDTSVFETAQAMITLNAEMFQISVIGLKTNGATYGNHINYYRQEGTNTYVREFNPETEMYEVDFEVLFMFSGTTWSDIFAKFLYYNFAVFAGLFIYNGATWNLAPLPEEFNASDKNMLEGTTAYSNEGVVSGGIMRRGIVDVSPTTEEQTLEDGYYEGVNISGVTSNIDSNIVAENIKKDVNILGVTGTLEEVVINNQNKEITENGTYTADEGYTGLGSVTVNVAGSGGGSTTVEGIKQFASEEEMNADTTAAVGDLAVVYGLKVEPLAVGSTFRKITFPETVNITVSSTINFSSWLEPVDSSKYLDLMTARLTATQFYLYAYTGTGTIRVQYTGSDGVYTRKTFSADGDAVVDGDTLDFGMDVQVVTSWNELLNNFFVTSSIAFSGLFEKTAEAWQHAPSQLTLESSNQLLPEVVAYGKNGVVTGDDSVYSNLDYGTLIKTISNQAPLKIFRVKNSTGAYEYDLETNKLYSVNKKDADLLDYVSIITFDDMTTSREFVAQIMVNEGITPEDGRYQRLYFMCC